LAPISGEGGSLPKALDHQRFPRGKVIILAQVPFGPCISSGVSPILRKKPMSLLKLLLAFVLVAAQLAAAELKIKVVDAAGEPVWARLEVRDAQGKMHQPAFALRDLDARNRPGGGAWYLGSFIAKGETVIEVPPGAYTVIIERGTEYERIEQQAEVEEGRSCDLVLTPKPWIRMNERGWWSADFHVHRRPEDAEKLALAEDLNLSAVFTMWNKRDLFEGRELPANPVVKLDPRHWLTLLNAEDERGGGAWMLHMIRERLDLGVEGRWFPPGLKFIEKAKKQRYVESGLPWFDCEKPFWWEVPVVMALSPPDSFGVLHNHFNQYGINDSEAWGRPRDQQKYPEREGFVEASLDLYYRYLNLGFRLPPSAGSASGVLPNPVGYNRIYVQLDEPFSVEAFYRNLRQGNSFVTNGPMLFFDSAELPGGRVQLTVEAASREPLDRIEIVANGKVIETFQAPENKTEFHTTVEMQEGLHSWVAARCFTRNDATIRMAHSRPIYLRGQWNMHEDAMFFIRWIDELIEMPRSEADRVQSDEDRRALIGLYLKARRFYEEKAR
jgi:hypothetical protein